VTAPLTPHNQPAHGQSAHSAHDRPAHDPWQEPLPAQEVLPHGTDKKEHVPALAAELRDAAVVTVAVALTGAVLGLLWLWLAPRVPLVFGGKAVFFQDSEGEQAVGADGTFILLALAMGTITAIGAFLFRRRGGIAVVLGLALGGFLGSLLAWRLGVWLGPGGDVVERAKEAGKGVVFDAPLKLRAWGALVAWPIASMLVMLGLTALFGPRDPDPYDPQHHHGGGMC
jgi:hypothetical protein